MISAIVLILTSVFTFFLAQVYAKSLRKSSSKGGAISKPKLYWLFYALSAYYLWPLIVGFDFGWKDNIGKWVLFIFGFMTIRAIVQSIIMYGTKNWSPWMGISFNVLSFLFTSFCLIKLFYFENMAWNYHPFQIMIVILWFCFLIDTYYAWAFWLIVGDETKGDKPIWFANAEDLRFQRINKVTSINNIILTILFVVLIISCFYA